MANLSLHSLKQELDGVKLTLNNFQSFKTIMVNGVGITAKTTSDTIEFIDGNNISLSLNTESNLITIANTYQHPTTHSPSIIAENPEHRFFTDTERTKLSNMENNANNYVHPVSHLPSIITQDPDNRFFTDTERVKLLGIEVSANNYTHPTGDGNSHIPPTGTTNDGKYLRAGLTNNSSTWSTIEWNEIDNKPFGFNPIMHDHSGNQITSKVNNAVNAENVEWTGILNKPTSVSGYGITDAMVNYPINLVINAGDNRASNCFAVIKAGNIVSYTINCRNIEGANQIPSSTVNIKIFVNGVEQTEANINSYDTSASAGFAVNENDVIMAKINGTANGLDGLVSITLKMN